MQAKDAKFLSCLKACNICREACRACNEACINGPRVNELLRGILLNRDCALFCNTASVLMEHGSEFLPQVLKLCEEACELCRTENERFDLPYCRRAAQACGAFVRECRRMHLE